MPQWVGEKRRVRYCGHFYSLFLCKWTHWHHRGQVFTVWGEGQKKLEGSVSGSEIDIVGLFVGYFLRMGLRDDDALMGWSRIDRAILWTPLLTPLA